MQGITNSHQPQISVTQIKSLLAQSPETGLEHHSGADEVAATCVSSAEHPLRHSLVFAPDLASFQKALQAEVRIVVVAKKIIPLLQKTELTQPRALFSTPDIPSAMALLLPLVDTKASRFAKGISPRASIATTASLGKNVSVADFVFIGEGVEIGDNTSIGANVVIESLAKIGANTILHPQVFIGSRCQVGNGCEIHPHTTVGSDGFSFVPQKDKSLKKIPQIGIVVIEDRVEIGANCAIDRATLTETRICSGTKLDNLIHIAHNVKIGKNSRLTAGFIIAGSSEIGENFLTGGQSSVTDHVKITSNVVLAGRSVVTKDIQEPGAYGGYPLEPLKSAMKTIANIAKLTEMRRQIFELRKNLGLNKKDESNS